MTVDAFKSFSKKQLILLNWWTDSSPYKNRDAIICDGSVRSGKTVCMFLSFYMYYITIIYITCIRMENID